MNSREAGYLWDMVEAITNIQEFIQDISLEEYSKSLLLQSAVERQLEILGEAARRIPETFQQKHTKIDWRGIIGLRNIISHQYDQVQPEIVWNIITVRLSPLLEQLQSLLPPLPQ
ncbi:MULTISPECIES: HepT-like ribonuclease domain-containing protein [Microcystis]|jgi:uncharacterized protein with HEPN domain|uniref:DUF86 domain-containing protein n=2 Tax=Microcystis flos-aquae TaxID=109615 RepID=A0A3E0KZB8_9CHRO|nr:MULTISPECIES: DUF86 domain-containing protein [Microcystis]REJ40447.1 MAG: DUF86 domain-containing protein [Microcystis flos-aquae TF09]KXS90855.1 hypothetical protein OA58_13730 [Microcystis aeruginosa NIES-88]MBD2623528.1 DUF86 domain-containing protein [Microcystis flos-aquae FACHB-1344]MCA2700149.1 DUF86 domain-containing protein [Microcystis sp. M179S2]BCU09854.1 DUF86 domain-containing protein [Microcystis aeruginosa]